MFDTLLLLVAVNAFAAQPAAPPPPAAEAAPRRAGRLFISPMGEPFRPQAGGGDPFEAWFRQADGNGDGALSLAELRGDADRFFIALDPNRDGEIDPDEMSRYEQEIAPEVQVGARGSGQGGGGGGARAGRGGRGGGGDGGGGGHGGGGRRGGGGAEAGGGGGESRAQSRPRPEGRQGAGRFGLLNTPQPIAGADTNFNRGVSAEEFRHAAGERFRLLDTNQDGRLLQEELQALRPASRPPGAGRRGRGGDAGSAPE